MQAAQDRKEQILDTAEDLLRRYGVSKTNVVDVARALGLTHAAVYRYFSTKSALREAIAERWLERISQPLEEIARSSGPPDQRLRTWVAALAKMKRRKVLDDPEVFRAYSALAEGAGTVVSAHVEKLESQVREIVRDGIDTGMFQCRHPKRAARAILTGTARYHHPHLVAAYAAEDSEKDLEALLDLLIAGLKAGAL